MWFWVNWNNNFSKTSDFWIKSTSITVKHQNVKNLIDYYRLIKNSKYLYNQNTFQLIIQKIISFRKSLFRKKENLISEKLKIIKII